MKGREVLHWTARFVVCRGVCEGVSYVSTGNERNRVPLLLIVTGGASEPLLCIREICMWQPSTTRVTVPGKKFIKGWY